MVWCFRKVDPLLFLEQITRAHLVFIALALLVIFSILWLNTIQWKWLLSEKHLLSFRKLFEVVAVCTSVANLIPWGHTFSIYYLGKNKEVGKTMALSVFTMDQLLGGIAKLPIFLLVSLFTPLPHWLQTSIQVFVISVLVFGLVLFFLSHFFRNLESNSHFISKWAHYLHPLRDWKRASVGLLMMFGIKFCEIVAIYLVQISFNIHLPLWAPLLLVTTTNLATTLPITPGNLGIYHAASIFTYQWLGLNTTEATVLALFHHLVYVIPLIIPGYFYSIRLGLRWKTLTPAGVQTGTRGV